MKSLLLLFCILFYSSGFATDFPIVPNPRDTASESTLVTDMKPTLFYEQDNSLLTTNLQVVIQTGGLHEPVGKTGLYNLMTELLLRGSKKRSRAQFQSELERLGADIDVRVMNDITVFSLKVIQENTFAAWEILEDALLNPTFSAKEFKELKVEQLAEIAHIKNSNNRLPGLAIRKEIFAGTPLEHPITGSLSTVEKLTLKDIKAAYDSMFVREGIIFAVSSSMKEKALTPQLEGFWKKLPNKLPLKGSEIPVNFPSKPKLIVVHKPKTATGVVLFAQKGITANHPDRYSLMTGNFSFGGEPLVSRLFKVIRGELGWTYYIGSSYAALGGLSRQHGFYVISSTPSVEFTTKTLQKSLSMWHEYMKEGLRSEEMDLAKDSLINSYAFEFDSPEKRLWQRLYSHLYDVPLLNQEQYTETISDISNSSLKKTLAKQHAKNGWIVAIVADKDALAAQLEKEQEGVPAEERFKIDKVVNPEDLVK